MNGFPPCPNRYPFLLSSSVPPRRLTPTRLSNLLPPSRLFFARTLLEKLFAPYCHSHPEGHFRPDTKSQYLGTTQTHEVQFTPFAFYSYPTCHRPLLFPATRRAPRPPFFFRASVKRLLTLIMFFHSPLLCLGDEGLTALLFFSPVWKPFALSSWPLDWRLVPDVPDSVELFCVFPPTLSCGANYLTARFMAFRSLFMHGRL